MFSTHFYDLRPIICATPPPTSDDQGAVHIANIPFYCYDTHIINLSNLTATIISYVRLPFVRDVCMKT